MSEIGTVAAGDIVDAIVRHRGSAVIVTGPGALSGALYARRHEPATIYNMDLVYATPTALGIALGSPGVRVLALEGDGSAIAGMASFSTIARLRPPNLAVVVVDNGAYGSTGEGWVRSATAYGTDLAAIASASGIADEHVLTLKPEDPAELVDAQVARVFTEPGPWVLVVRVELDAATVSRARPRTGIDWADAATVCRLDLAARSQQA